MRAICASDGEPPQFLAPDDLVRDEHVRDPALDHRLGLADLLHAHADGAERDLLQRDDRAFVGLGMRPRPDTGAGDALGQAAQIALERVEIDDEGGGVDLVEGHADLGRRAGGHGRASSKSEAEARATAAEIATGRPRRTDDHQIAEFAWYEIRMDCSRRSLVAPAAEPAALDSACDAFAGMTIGVLEAADGSPDFS